MEPQYRITKRHYSPLGPPPRTHLCRSLPSAVPFSYRSRNNARVYALCFFSFFALRNHGSYRFGELNFVIDSFTDNWLASIEETSNVQRRDPWWVSRPFSWGTAGIGSAITGAVVGSTIGGAWQGVKNAFGSSNSNSDEEQRSSDDHQPDGSNIIIVPYPYPANQPSGYAQSYPQSQNSPPWQNVPSEPQNQGNPQNQNGPQWQNAPSYPQNLNIPQGQNSPPWQQAQPVPQAQQGQQDSQLPSAGLAATLSSPVVCRKYPDTIISGPLDTYPGGSRIFAKCWTTASMSGALGKIENSPIWVKTDRGC